MTRAIQQKIHNEGMKPDRIEHVSGYHYQCELPY